MAKMTAKMERFVEEYLVDLNATQAAIRAGYSEKTARSVACENLTKPNIQAAIQEARQKLSDETGISVQRVLQEYGRIGFADPRKFYDEDGMLIPITELDEDTARAIGGIDYHHGYEFTREGESAESGSKGAQKDKQTVGATTKIKLIDKKGALDSIAKHLGMFTDKGTLDIVHVHIGKEDAGLL